MADIFLNYIRENRNISNRVSAPPEATGWCREWYALRKEHQS